MAIVFFLFWVILNGKLTAEIAVFGIVISAAVYVFMCFFLNWSPRKDLFYMKRLPILAEYLGVLIREVVKANLTMIHFLLHPEILAEPALIVFHTDLRSSCARVLLANSITLTPGTITVSMENGEYLVHCYDRTMGEGIADSDIVRILRKLED